MIDRLRKKRAELVGYIHLADRYRSMVDGELKRYYAERIEGYEARVRQITSEIRQLEQRRLEKTNILLTISMITVILSITGILTYLGAPSLTGYYSLSTFANVSVDNTAPAVLTVEVLPANPNETSDLNCTATGSDDNYDNLSYYYKWFVNGTHKPEFDNISLILDGNVTIGANWTCEAVAFDGTDNGTAVNSSYVDVNYSKYPLGPMGLNISLDEAEGVTLTWDVADTNYTKDIMICNTTSLQSGWSNCVTIGVGEESFLDAAALQNRRVYYRVFAVNDRGLNKTIDIVGKQNFTFARKSGDSAKNYLGLYLNASYISDAEDLLELSQEFDSVRFYIYQPEDPTVDYWVCTEFSCPPPAFCSAEPCNFNINKTASAVYVYLKTDSPISMEWSWAGSLIENQSISMNYVEDKNKHNGRHFVSLYGNTTYTDAHDLMDSIPTSNSVNRWDATTQEWDGSIDIGPFKIGNFEIALEEAYSVFITDDVNWQQE